MPKYTIEKNTLNQDIIKREDENGQVWWVPTDPANSDYQRYLNPEAEQSTPSL